MFNKVIFIGNICNDVELRQTPNGKSVCNITLASNRKFGDTETTFFLRCTIWGNQAELVANYRQKGDILGVEGRLHTESWEKDGNKVERTICMVESLILLPGRNRSQAGGNGGSSRRSDTRNRNAGSSGPNPGFLDHDDIPF